MLDNIGIIVRVGEAAEAYAGVLGKTADQLTDAERKQAFLNATMEAARTKLGGVGEEVASNAYTMQRFESAMVNLQSEIGSAFLPLILKTAEGLTEFVNALDADNIQRWAAAVGVGVATLVALNVALVGAKASTWAFTAALAKNPIGIMAVTATLAAGSLLELLGAFEESEDAAYANKTALEAQQYALEALKDMASELTTVSSQVTEEQKKGAKALQQRLDILNATNEFEKEFIKLGHEASLEESLLINKLVAKNIKLKEEADLIKERLRLQRERIALDKKISKILEESKEHRNIIDFINKGYEEYWKNIDKTKVSFLELIDSLEMMPDLDEHLRINLKDKFGEDIDVQISGIQALSMAFQGATGHTKEFNEVLSESMVKSLEGMTATTGAAMGLSDALFAHDKQLLDQKTEGEIQAVLSSRKSEKRKAAEIQNIKEKAAIEERKLRAKQKPFMIAEAISNTAVGMSKAMALAFPLNFIVSGLIAATGAAQVATISAQKFAKGGEFITDRPEIIQVGEAGREHVKITPIDRPADRALGSSPITINFSGNVLSQDFIENEAIPQIKEAVRRGADLGVA